MRGPPCRPAGPEAHRPGIGGDSKPSGMTQAYQKIENRQSKIANSFYPFIPVVEMPWMKVRWVKKKSTMTGRIIIVDAAIR